MGASGRVTLRRLVLDTNVLVSALLFPSGSLSWFRPAWQSRQIRPVVNRDTTAELIRVLTYPKFRLSDSDREELLADCLPYCETIAADHPPPEVPPCRDAHDRVFLELALAANADALVTGDNDLLALADSFQIPILEPAAVKERLFG